MKTLLIVNQKGGCGKSMAAVTLASALAGQGRRVGLADADPQASALEWLAQRPASAATIRMLDWSRDKHIGQTDSKLDWLVVDAPGALPSERMQQLAAESDLMLIPVQPSFFDVSSTRRFLQRIDEIKRVRKGRVKVFLLANRIRTNSITTAELADFFNALGQRPLAWIAERSIYPQLASQGLSIFDQHQRVYQLMQQQWQPVIDLLLQYEQPASDEQAVVAHEDGLAAATALEKTKKVAKTGNRKKSEADESPAPKARQDWY